MKKLDKIRGKPLLDRAEKVTAAGARLLVPVGRREAPIGDDARIIRGEFVPPGQLRRSVGTKRLRKRGIETIRPTLFGSIFSIASTAFYAHMIPRGTRSHSLERKRSYKSDFVAFNVGEVRPLSAFKIHPGSKPDPWVDRTWDLLSRARSCAPSSGMSSIHDENWRMH